MIITGTQLQTLRRTFSAAFNRGLLTAPPATMEQFATPIPMSTQIVELGMIKQIPGLREWIGDRVFHRLAAHGYSMRAITYEDSVSVPREQIQDDNLGLFVSSMEQLAVNAQVHSDQLLSALLRNGAAATSLAYDGFPFFSTTHPENIDGTITNVSNYTSGAGPAWYLLDASRPLRPLILGNRTSPEFVAMDEPDSDSIFYRNQADYGVCVRKGVQYGLWQLAYRHEGALDATTFEAAMEAMMSRRSDSGENLGIQGTHVVVPVARWAEARKLFEAGLVGGGDSNIYQGQVKIVVNPRLPNT